MEWSISGFWARVEGSLFPQLQECLPPMTAEHRRLVLVLEVMRIEEFVAPLNWHWLGAPPKDRTALARAFVAKAAYNLQTTKALIDRLRVDEVLRRLCGWEMRRRIPSESTFSRAFAEFAATRLLDAAHGILVQQYMGDDLVFHVSTDSTAIEARERPASKPPGVASRGVQTSAVTTAPASSTAAAGEGAKEEIVPNTEAPKRKRGRPRKGEARPAQEAKRKRGRPRKEDEKIPEPTRLERQLAQTVEEAIAELPKECSVGAKRNSKGRQETWTGFKLHTCVGDGGLPFAAVTTSASLHDSQAAIPLLKLTASRVVSLYDLMDSAYDARAIHECSRQLEHVPIIDANPRGAGKDAYVPMAPDRAERYKNRSASERFNSRLKDDHGGRTVRVRGHAKVHTHLMFGLLVIFAEALLGLLS